MNPRPAHIDACRKRAVELMDSPRGHEAFAGGYYTEIFTWLFDRLERGLSPCAPPEEMVAMWKAAGEAKRERVAMVAKSAG